MGAESETVEPSEAEESEQEIIVAECEWVKGNSYAVSTFKKLFPPIYRKVLPEEGKLRIKKVHPTSHRYGGYVIEAVVVGAKTEEYTWTQFWWTTQDKFYYANVSKVRNEEPLARNTRTRRKRNTK
jgi:hypothetical protein